MTRLRLSIQDHVGSKKTTVEVPDNVPMENLIPALVTSMGLPTNQFGGNRIVYRLDHRPSGKRLQDQDTFSSAGVHSGDTLTLLPEVTAGKLAPW